MRTQIDVGMTTRVLAGTAVISILMIASPATAQFGAFQLPQSDFTWTWGGRKNPRDFEDISVIGSDGAFRCTLEAKLRIGTRLSRMDTRNIESELRGAINFVQSVNYQMNDLDARREIDWAVLECERPQRQEREQNREEEDDDNDNEN